MLPRNSFGKNNDKKQKNKNMLVEHNRNIKPVADNVRHCAFLSIFLI